ncbi:MAG TPA: DNA integrity scanning protein DisA [Actinobacteria bacterium]|nr:DNA integrity scanning protein DisA [Actinomycetota bacterium]
MTPKVSVPLDVLRRFAPGTPLREAAEMIMRQGTGSLILVGSGSVVDAVSTGGFELVPAPFTAQKLAELSKMDGGIVVDDVAGVITRANVHFIPDPSIATEETGTRFRTAERLAIQTGLPVLAVSEEGRALAVVFSPEGRFVLQDPTSLFAQANQRLQVLERFRRQLDDSLRRLDRDELAGVATYREAVAVIQRAAIILRIAEELETIAVELGDEAPLVRIQVEDLVAGVAEIAELVNFDYQPRRPRKGSSVFRKLDELGDEDVYNLGRVAAALGLTPLDREATPRGARLLAGIPRLPAQVREAIIRRFGDLGRLKSASIEALSGVEGVGRARARQIRSYLDGLLRAGSLPGPED